MRVKDDELRPLLRGLLHAYAFWVALVAGATLVALAPDATARVAALVYGAGLCALFAASGLYHRWRWNPRWRPLLRRIDHSTIFVFIAASYVPIALLVLSGGLRVAVLVAVAAGAIGGVALTVGWPAAPAWLDAAAYLALGWVAVVAAPDLVERLPGPPLALLVAGGLLYSAGAVVYATRRPDPWPRTFGFHEVFHTLVILAAAAHFTAIAGWVIPAGT
ncbi:MAG TPA: hemolysin III family protein [Solirubrobacteraceae bacterium]|nr:hemolysin III family protein [Solirubrobacteraceae bacterium]